MITSVSGVLFGRYNKIIRTLNNKSIQQRIQFQPFINDIHF